MNTNWEILKDKIYYTDDGSFRDIFVLDTELKDWEKWIDFVNTNYEVEFYNGIAEKTEIKFNKNIAIGYLNKKNDLSINASIKLNGIIIKCYFFCIDEIDNDIMPKEINSMSDHNILIDYFNNVSALLNKKIILTDGNCSTDRLEFISIDNNKVTINLN